MIRQPFNSALGRTRADLSRVKEGIAASLRAFSTAQQLAANPTDNNGNHGSPQPTGRQRAAAAVSDLFELSRGGRGRSSPGPAPEKPESAFKKINSRAEHDPITVPKATLSGSNPNIIRGGLRGGIRGRGRGGFMRGGAGLGGRGGGRGRGRGGGGGGGGGGGRGGRRGKDGEDADDSTDVKEGAWSAEVLAMREAKEIGSSHDFDPTISREDLAGWGPAVPTTGSRSAKDDTVIRQARILGGGRQFEPTNIMASSDMWKQYTLGSGVFFPSLEMKKRSAELMGLESFPPLPKETKDAVLQSALLGTYQGPEYVELKDTLGTVYNYVRRDASWSADAQRRIEEKVRSLLPGGNTVPAAKAAGASR
ncbi:hypothetical protein F5B22DRAFT_595352 [Xylaria bambusicola]|uniref:uncharacterized protein n=1 Tax=Xylaria bambusicola TaxID=326684 RepID=UPI0020083071|nr:uncharacterized protein F5B22DRAFT_595352 [Xylaria bambusicola]KAI0521543.1 hypothetical protein F5B22DRAFT_595352 [Xylaria bambusicola]